ncbi:WDR44_2 [Blepharisma stoltei]|uniref:WD repeat-containing protein 55 homolog n=1 Tax=Blepharisma stoltei TaxID=1481888 RepID=A0AAU9IU85_9CILI|nr:unnamed protein product [Blepharisma stoltei]
MEPNSSSGDEFFDACETEDQIDLYQRSCTVQYKAEAVSIKTDFQTSSFENSPTHIARSYTEAVPPLPRAHAMPVENKSVHDFEIEKPKDQPVVLLEHNGDYKITKKEFNEFNNLQLLQEIELPHRENNVICILKFSYDSRKLTVGGSNGRIIIFDVNLSAGGAISSVPSHILNEHNGPVTDISWSRQNNLLSSSADGTVKLWSSSQDSSIDTIQLPCEVSAVTFNPIDSNYFVTASGDLIIRLFRFPDKIIEGFYQAPGEITSICYSPSGEFLAVGIDKGQVVLYQGRSDHKLRLGTTLICRNRRGLLSGGKRVTGLEFMDEEHLCVTTNDSNIRLYRYKDNLLLQKYKGTENIKFPIRSSLSEDGEHLLCGSEKGRIFIWNTNRSCDSPGKNNSHESFCPRKKKCPEYAVFAPIKIVNMVQKGISNESTEIKHVIFTIGSKQNIRVFANQSKLNNS